MAHLMKATRGQIGGLTRHFERYRKENGEYIKFNNQEIDISKTNLNYNLAEKKNQLDFIKMRTQEVRCLNRKDVNVMRTWVITKPSEVTLEEQDLFFEESYKFLKKEYGMENIISSYVHLDETTPHMHFAFVPVVTDKKKGDLKVSAKELITRQYLQEFHPRLEEHMKKVFGREIGILNEATKEGNKSIEQLKREGAKKELEDQKHELKKTKKELKMLDFSKDKIKKIDRIEKKDNLWNRNFLQIKKEDFEALIQMAKSYMMDVNYHRSENMVLRKENQEFKERFKRQSMSEVMEKAKQESKIRHLENNVETLNKFVLDKDLNSEFHKFTAKKTEKDR